VKINNVLKEVNKLNEGVKTKVAALGLAAALGVTGIGIKMNNNQNINLKSQGHYYDYDENDPDSWVNQPAEELFEYNTKYGKMIEKYIDQNIYTIEQIELIIQAESTGNPEAVSHLGKNYGYGLMQVSKALLQDYNEAFGSVIKQQDLADPETCIKIGCWFLNSIPRRIGLSSGLIDNDDLKKVYIAYNAGVRSFNNSYNNYYSKGIDPKSGKEYKGLVRLELAKQELD
jgi:soluble lytic murein transglycosylase-like protein